MSKKEDSKNQNKNGLNDLTGKEWIKFTKSWKIYKPKPRDNEEIQHPAKFPLQMIKEHIKFFTHENDWVIDPFLGTGTTLEACRATNRKGLGVELISKYAEIARNKIKQKGLQDFSGSPNRYIIIEGDIREKLRQKTLLNDYGPTNKKFNYCITSPPYWNMLKKSRGGVKSLQKQREEKGLDTSYSDENNLDLGNIEDYDLFLKELSDVFIKLSGFLNSGAYLTVVIQNIRDKDGKMKPLAWDLGRKIGKSDKYILKQERLWLQNDKPLGIWGYPSEYVSNVHHHYCLNFKRK